MPRPALLVAAFLALLTASCSGSIDGFTGRDRDKLTMYVHVRMADAVFAAESAAQGELEAFDELADVRADLQAIAPQLKEGLRSADADKFDSELAQSLLAMDHLLRERETVLEALEAGASAMIRVPRLSAQMSEVLRGMSDADAPVSQINIANRQLVLLDRTARRIEEIRDGGDAAITAADALQRDFTVFEQVLQALAAGSPETGIDRVEQPAARAAIDSVLALNRDQGNDVNRFLAASTTLAEVQHTVEELRGNRLDLQEAAPPAY